MGRELFVPAAIVHGLPLRYGGDISSLGRQNQQPKRKDSSITMDISVASKVKVAGSGGMASKLAPLACTSRASTSCYAILAIIISSQCACMDTLVAASGRTPWCD